MSPIVGVQMPLLPNHKLRSRASVYGAVFNVFTSIIGAVIMSIPATLKVLRVIPVFDKSDSSCSCLSITGMFMEQSIHLLQAFREFPSWVDDQFQLKKTAGNQSELEMNEITNKEVESPKKKMRKRVAMYCTGGIRCEKASSFLLSKGLKEEGGTLKYLEEVPKTESLWEGECFVFDKRVSVEHGLEQGTFNNL
ncbi:hypothetical protein Pint_06621 [Pistacia integerrima]|uniref:Uncharacterized protein n=1 Tax=Pistacia integerrima TaxID=434235 RepID=A0ACC0Z513_9ROSI|nr:hypothetical protein Pint_06621 [Pistacia integerrima]